MLETVRQKVFPNVRNVVLKSLDYLDSCMVGDFAFMADAVQLFQAIVADMAQIADNIEEVTKVSQF